MNTETPEQIFVRVMSEHAARQDAERRYAELLSPIAPANSSAPTTLSLGAPRARHTITADTDHTITADEGARRSSLSLKD